MQISTKFDQFSQNSFRWQIQLYNMLSRLNRSHAKECCPNRNKDLFQGMSCTGEEIIDSPFIIRRVKSKMINAIKVLESSYGIKHRKHFSTEKAWRRMIVFADRQWHSSNPMLSERQ